MKPLPSRSAFTFLAAVGLVMGSRFVAQGCGLNWDEPKSHFEGVSFQGYVFLVEPLGEMELKDGRKLPLRALFRSESNLISPYLGHGWELPLLESHIVALDQRWFRVVEPTGWYRFFWRDEKDPAVLHGQGNWKGVIRGNSISVMADCGDRLDFQDGRLMGMELKGERLTIERAPDGSAAVKQGATTLLAVQRSPLRGEIELRLGQKQKLVVGYADRPIIEVVAGRPVVRMQVKSLGSITAEDGTSRRTWDYAVDEKLNPTMTIGERKIVWNPTTRHALADGGWTYEIKPGEGARDNAAIGRTNAKNHREFWYKDEPNGQETVQGADGVRQCVTYFITKRNYGAIRLIEAIRFGKKSLKYRASYDDSGRLTRETIEDGSTIEFGTNSDGDITFRRTAGGVEIDAGSYKGVKEVRPFLVAGKCLRLGFDARGKATMLAIHGTHIRYLNIGMPDS